LLIVTGMLSCSLLSAYIHEFCYRLEEHRLEPVFLVHIKNYFAVHKELKYVPEPQTWDKKSAIVKSHILVSPSAAAVC